MAPSRIQIWTTVSFLHFRLREFNNTWSCVKDDVKSWDRKLCKIKSICQYLYGLVDYTTKGCGIISQKRRGRLTCCLPLDSAASPRPASAGFPVNAQHSCPTCREEDSTRTERASQRRFEAPRTVYGSRDWRLRRLRATHKEWIKGLGRDRGPPVGNQGEPGTAMKTVLLLLGRTQTRVIAVVRFVQAWMDITKLIWNIAK